jgi:hypothetical protein
MQPVVAADHPRVEASRRSERLGTLGAGAADLPNVYSRHAPGLRTSIGGPLLRLCLGGLWIELLVTLDTGWQIGRPRCPIGACGLQRRGGVLWLTATPAVDKRDPLVVEIAPFESSSAVMIG